MAVYYTLGTVDPTAEQTGAYAGGGLQEPFIARQTGLYNSPGDNYVYDANGNVGKINIDGSIQFLPGWSSDGGDEVGNLSIFSNQKDGDGNSVLVVKVDPNSVNTTPATPAITNYFNQVQRQNVASQGGGFLDTVMSIATNPATIIAVAVAIVAPELAPAIGAELGLTGTAASAAGYGAIGAGTGAVTTAANGGDATQIAEAALKGGATGAAGAAIGSAANAAVGDAISATEAAAAGGAAKGAIGSALSGNNVLAGATSGALGSALGTEIGGDTGKILGTAAGSATGAALTGGNVENSALAGALTGGASALGSNLAPPSTTTPDTTPTPTPTPTSPPIQTPSVEPTAPTPPTVEQPTPIPVQTPVVEQPTPVEQPVTPPTVEQPTPVEQPVVPPTVEPVNPMAGGDVIEPPPTTPIINTNQPVEQLPTNDQQLIDLINQPTPTLPVEQPVNPMAGGDVIESPIDPNVIQTGNKTVTNPFEIPPEAVADPGSNVYKTPDGSEYTYQPTTEEPKSTVTVGSEPSDTDPTQQLIDLINQPPITFPTDNPVTSTPIDISTPSLSQPIEQPAPVEQPPVEQPAPVDTPITLPTIDAPSTEQPIVSPVNDVQQPPSVPDVLPPATDTPDVLPRSTLTPPIDQLINAPVSPDPTQQLIDLLYPQLTPPPIEPTDLQTPNFNLDTITVDGTKDPVQLIDQPPVEQAPVEEPPVEEPAVKEQPTKSKVQINTPSIVSGGSTNTGGDVTRSLSSLLGTPSTSILGQALQSSGPDPATNPTFSGDDKNKKNVWNTESLRTALGLT